MIQTERDAAALLASDMRVAKNRLEEAKFWEHQVFQLYQTALEKRQLAEGVVQDLQARMKSLQATEAACASKATGRRALSEGGCDVEPVA